MTSSEDTAVATEPALHKALAEIAEIDKKIVALNNDLDALKDRREALEQVAIEELSTQRLEAVKVAGRSWRIEWFHGFSAPEEKKEVVMEAAKRAGIPLDSLTSVNTARLKALLTERAKAAGTDARRPYSAGTEFDGLVGEYVAPKLRHLTVG